MLTIRWKEETVSLCVEIRWFLNLHFVLMQTFLVTHDNLIDLKNLLSSTSEENQKVHFYKPSTAFNLKF